MSTTTAGSYYFRRRTMGRAASPPTWACYEQIHNDDSDSCSDSCSEDDEDYNDGNIDLNKPSSDSEEHKPIPNTETSDIDMDMDMDEDSPDGSSKEMMDIEKQNLKDVKGKQRAVDPEPESPSPPTRQRKKRTPVYTLRPILTIQRSQGFVWNQDLFVPPYIKDRYIASTSPPNSRGFISTSVSSTNSAITDYEVEVVEIRVKEGELDDLIP